MTPSRQALILDDYRRGTPIRDILCDWCISGSTLTVLIRRHHAELHMPQRRNNKRRNYLKRQARRVLRGQRARQIIVDDPRAPCP